MDLLGVGRVDGAPEDRVRAPDGEREAALHGQAEARAEADHQHPHADARDAADDTGVGDGEVEVDQRGEEAEEQEDVGEDAEPVALAFTLNCEVPPVLAFVRLIG